MFSKRTIKDKEKEKEKRIENPWCFALKPKQSPRGLRRKALNPSALNQLVGSHRLSARYMGGWVEFGEL